MARKNPLMILKNVAVDALSHPRETAGKVIDTVARFPLPGRKPRTESTPPTVARTPAGTPARTPARAPAKAPAEAPVAKAPAAAPAVPEVEVTPADIARNVHRQPPAKTTSVPGDKLPTTRRA